jgi:hypothetical protein
LLWTAVFAVAVCPLLAQTTLSINVKGTVGAVLSGSDPLGASGGSGQLTVTASESLTPTSTTATSATYTLPPGAITGTVSGITFTTTSNSTMKMIFPATGPDYLVLIAVIKEFGVNIQVVGTANLKHGSYTSAVLLHPTTFTPSPQKLTSATTATGPGSKIKYTFLGSTTVLGFSGYAANSQAAVSIKP